MEQTYSIEISGVSESDANKYASELRNLLRSESPNIIVDRKRTDEQSMDFGSSLLLIISSPEIINAVDVFAPYFTAISNVLSDWVKLRYSAKLTIKNSDGEVILENVSAKDAHKFYESFMSKMKV